VTKQGEHDLEVTMVRTTRVYDPAAPEDGTRVLVMRYWPRGVRREAIDEWYCELGTTPEMIAAWKAGKIDWNTFEYAYREQLAEHQPLLEALGQRAARETLTLLCGCADEQHCHRTVLKRLLEEIASRLTPTAEDTPSRAQLPRAMELNWRMVVRLSADD
jgi:uncharacterized protein YeaO (DUF488 family)